MTKSWPNQSPLTPCHNDLSTTPMTQTTSITNTKSTMQGFTLVEIMIAITLSLFLISGLVKVYSINKKSAHVQSELASMQENERFAVDLLNREIRMAGFYDQTKATSIYPIPKFYTAAVAKTLTGLTNNFTGDGSGNASDTISIIYESGTDCLGNAVTETDNNHNTLAVNTYFVNSQTLYCQGNSNSIAQPIAENVENMQVLYGVNTDKLQQGVIPTANKYVDFSKADMSKVVSVRIALLFKTDQTVKNQDDDRTYYLLNAPGIQHKDKYRREVITTTISLRN